MENTQNMMNPAVGFARRADYLANAQSDIEAAMRNAAAQLGTERTPGAEIEKCLRTLIVMAEMVIDSEKNKVCGMHRTGLEIWIYKAKDALIAKAKAAA